MARHGVVSQTAFYVQGTCFAVLDRFGIFQKIRRAEKTAAQNHALLGESDGEASTQMDWQSQAIDPCGRWRICCRAADLGLHPLWGHSRV